MKLIPVTGGGRTEKKDAAIQPNGMLYLGKALQSRLKLDLNERFTALIDQDSDERIIYLSVVEDGDIELVKRPLGVFIPLYKVIRNAGWENKRYLAEMTRIKHRKQDQIKIQLS